MRLTEGRPELRGDDALLCGLCNVTMTHGSQGQSSTLTNMAVTVAVLTADHLPGLDVRVVADLGRQGVRVDGAGVGRGHRLRGGGGLGGGGGGRREGVVGSAARVNRGRRFAD